MESARENKTRIIEEILLKIEKIDYYIDWYTRNVLPGEWRSRIGGQGFEFDRIDEYELGDDPRTINWRATARQGGQVVLRNRYLDNKNIAVYQLIDVSGSMKFGTSRRTKREIAAEISSIITYSANKINDEVGLIIWPNISVLPAANQDSLFLAYAEAILRSDSNSSSESLEDVLRQLPERRSLVFLVSDFIGMTDMAGPLGYYSKIHDLVPILIEDRLEISIPSGFCFINFKDMESGEMQPVILTKESARRFSMEAERRRKRIREIFHDLGIDYLSIKEGYEPEQLTEFFLRRRTR